MLRRSEGPEACGHHSTGFKFPKICFTVLGCQHGLGGIRFTLEQAGVNSGLLNPKARSVEEKG